MVRKVSAVAAFVIGVVLSSGVSAQPPPTETAVATPPPPAPPRGPSAEAVPRLDEHTALMVGDRRLKIGVLYFEYGLTEHFSIGTQPPVWAVRAFTQVLVPNLNAKFQFVDRDPLWVTAMASAYYADISNGEASGQLLNIPLSLYASVRANRHLYLHGEGTYVFVQGFGNGDLNRAHIGGTLAARAVQGQLMAEVRLVRWFSLTALGRYEFYTSNLTVSGSGPVDPYTTASVNGELAPRVEHPWEVIGGVALLLNHFHFTLGAGYGYYFVPGMDLPMQKRGFVPDASLSVLFTL